MQPGDTVHPSPDPDKSTGVGPSQESQEKSPPPPSDPTGNTASVEDTVSPEVENQPATLAAPDEVATDSFYKPDDTTLPATDDSDHKKADVISWEASEYVDHQKPMGWYAALIAAAIAVIGLVYLLTNGDIVTTIAIAIAAVLFGIVAARKPRTLHYAIDSSGITIGNKAYPYAMFKTFSVITETAIHSVQVTPLKRFMPPISLYFPPDQEQQIVEVLGQYLPYENRGHDVFDRLMTRIRF